MMGFFQVEPDTPIQGYWKKNRNTISAYLQSPRLPVAFAGSSLTAALKFAGMEQCVYNFGLIGESALTGLDVIKAGEELPRTVFVEINFPERESNQSLINSAEGFLAKKFPEFIYTTPVNFFWQQLSGFYHSLRDQSQQKVDMVGHPEPQDRLLRELEIQRETFKNYLPSGFLVTKLAEFRIKIDELEQRGVKVIFLELPVHPELENSNRVVQVRAAFKRAFPDNDFVEFDVLSRGVHIKTADGLHLNDNDGKGVLANLRTYFQDDCMNMEPR